MKDCTCTAVTTGASSRSDHHAKSKKLSQTKKDAIQFPINISHDDENDEVRIDQRGQAEFFYRQLSVCLSL
jgi:hypothetical protein